MVTEARRGGPGRPLASVAKPLNLRSLGLMAVVERAAAFRLGRPRMALAAGVNELIQLN